MLILLSLMWRHSTEAGIGAESLSHVGWLTLRKLSLGSQVGTRIEGMGVRVGGGTRIEGGGVGVRMGTSMGHRGVGYEDLGEGGAPEGKMGGHVVHCLFPCCMHR